MPIVTPEIEQYAKDHTTGEPDYLTALGEETRSSTDAPQMMVGSLEGRFLSMLIAMQQPQLVLEIGTFTGYSALSMAAALPPGGQIITCDIDERHVEIARRHIDNSSYRDVIDVRLGPALDTIVGLAGPFDFVFIDADKSSYSAYYDAVLPKLAERGVLAVDNVLWSGRVLDPDDRDEETKAIRAFNDKVAADDGVEAVMLTVRDGVTLIRRRPQQE